MRPSKLTTAVFAIAAGLAGAAMAGPATYTPGPAGAPYSAATEVNGVLYISGQIGTGADGKPVEGFEAQTKLAMDKTVGILKAHGRTVDDVFKCTVMITDPTKWGDFNKLYASYFTPGKLPARSALLAAGLPAGSSVEIECLASKPGK